MKTNYWLYPTEVFPEMGYSEPKTPKKRCGNCTHGAISREGAYIPGWKCLLMEKKYRKLNPKRRIHEPPCIYSEVDIRFGICNKWERKPKIK